MMAIDETWVPWFMWGKYEPCPWRPDYVNGWWERPFRDGVVRFTFELGLSPHDCEAFLSMAREGLSGIRLVDHGWIVGIEIDAGSAFDDYLKRQAVARARLDRTERSVTPCPI